MQRRRNIGRPARALVSVVETKLSTRLVREYLTDDEYRRLQQALVADPELGAVIPGSGGIRKVRWGIAGRGSRGGRRVINFSRVRQSADRG